MKWHREQRSRSQSVLVDACLKIGVPFLWLGPGTMLISGRGVRDVLKDVESAGYDVIGLEGFEVDGPDIHPRIDLIFDSSVARRGGAVAVAGEWGDEVWIDVCLRAS